MSLRPLVGSLGWLYVRFGHEVSLLVPQIQSVHHVLGNDR
jgi:hypothetical protein